MNLVPAFLVETLAKLTGEDWLLLICWLLMFSMALVVVVDWLSSLISYVVYLYIGFLRAKHNITLKRVGFEITSLYCEETSMCIKFVYKRSSYVVPPLAALKFIKSVEKGKEDFVTLQKRSNELQRRLLVQKEDFGFF